jgi:hypothetical protein
LRKAAGAGVGVGVDEAPDPDRLIEIGAPHRSEELAYP